MAFDAPGVGALLLADTASHGWTAVARFHGVDADALGAAIANGSVFAAQVGVLGGGAPDGLFG